VKCSYNKRGFKAVKCPECRLLRVPGHDRHCTKCAGSGRLACIGCGGKGRIKLEEALAGLAVVENLFEVEDPGQEIPTLLKPCRELSQQDLIAALRCHEPGHEKVVLGSFKGMAVARDRVRLLGDEIEYSIYRVEPDQFVLRRRSNLGAKDAGRWYMTERYGRI
jgi:ribosomal protein S27E